MTRHFSLKQRIMFFLVPLMLAVAGTSGVIVYDNFKTWQKSNHLDSSIHFYFASSALIHETQVERGKTSVFLSGGIKKEELETQREKVNEKIKATEHSFAKLDKNTIEATSAIIKEIQDTRKYASEPNAQGSETGRRFGEAIDKLIRTQVLRARAFPLDGLESKLISQSIFEGSKENMGKLRASISTILAKDLPIDLETRNKLEVFRSGILANLKSPGLSISDDTKKKVEEILKSPQWMAVEDVVNKVTTKAESGKYDQDSKLFFSNITGIINSIYGLISAESERLNADVDAVMEKSKRGFWIFSTLLVLGLSFILALSLKVVGDISRELEKLSNTLSSAATQTATISSDMSNSSASLASGATEQAAALQETVASLEEVRAMVSKNSDNAQQAKTVATHSAEGARKGRETMSELVSAINDIHKSNEAIQSQVEASNNELTEITKVIGEIASKTKVINEIVFQTKLLSFNASVEAARAGEHGKGFAVVAEEVGNLAQMSGNASKEISQLLDSSIQKVETIVRNSKTKVTSLMNVGKEKVNLGTQFAKKCDEVLDDVLKGAEEMNIMVAEIATASHEQSQGVDEIAKAMNQLESVTQSNSAASNQVSGVANELNSNPKNMEEQVNHLILLTKGGTSRASTIHKKDPVIQPSNVIKMVRPAPTVENEPEIHKKIFDSTPMLKAAGAENTPLENDPRFEEI